MMTPHDVLTNDWPLRLASDPDHSCPCGTIEGEGFTIRLHCWRVPCSTCAYSGVHVSGSLDDATKRALGEHVRDHNPWTDYTDWTLVIEGDQGDL